MACGAAISECKSPGSDGSADTELVESPRKRARANPATHDVEASDSHQPIDFFSLMHEAAQLDAAEAAAPDVEAARAPTVFLNNGDVHVCRGMHCPYLELNEERFYVCKCSGQVVAATTIRDDYSTGRIEGSANPDDTAGEPVGGSWRPKRDMIALSKQAFVVAGSHEEDVETYVCTLKHKEKPVIKRGARCVDAPVDEAVARTRLATGVGGLAGGGIGVVAPSCSDAMPTPSAAPAPPISSWCQSHRRDPSSPAPTPSPAPRGVASTLASAQAPTPPTPPSPGMPLRENQIFKNHCDQGSPAPGAGVSRSHGRSREAVLARRAGATDRAFAALLVDAAAVINKLVNFDKRKRPSAPNQPHAAGPSSLVPAEPTAAQRLTLVTDPRTLFELALRKYARECIASGVVPQLDVLHNMEISANQIARDNKERADVSRMRSTAVLMQLKIRQMMSQLACRLWQASSQSPYMRLARRGSDSFRPFVAGVLYALKRGVALSDGTVIVPQSALMAAALPALRATASNSTAKSLHASSHRGLCTLHRCVSSCTSVAQEHALFGECAKLASELSYRVASKTGDLV
jgi:hypothetical protein